MVDNNQTYRLFELCDVDQKGYLTKNDLKKACPQLAPNEIAFIFSCLDTNNSGTIEKSEFCAGFKEALFKGESRGFDGIQGRVNYSDDRRDSINSTSSTVIARNNAFIESEIASNKRRNVEDVFMEDNNWTNNKNDNLKLFDSTKQLSPNSISFLSKKSHSCQSFVLPRFLQSSPQPQFSDNIPCKNEVLQLYEELQSSGVPQIMAKFEEVVGNLCREIDQKREENQILYNIQKTERDKYNKRMTEIENEIDNQLMMAEKKAREEEQIRLTKEKHELKERLESEMRELQSNIEHLQKMEKALRRESKKNDNSEEQQENLKKKLEVIAQENHILKNNLADNHLEMTLIKAELTELKSEYKAKSLNNIYETADFMNSINESENMQRQLQLLYDANKRLQDTNGNLRGALDQRTAIIHQLNLAKQGYPILSNSGNTTTTIPYNQHLLLTSAIDSSQQMYVAPTIHQCNSISENSANYLNPDDDDRDSGFPQVRSGSARTSISDFDLFRCASVDTDNKESTSNYNSSLTEFCGPPDRTFRVVMCGDSSVGKSSIITRIVKGTYQQNIASTLGVDFHVKCLKMSKTNVAVQLWDTAGQESLCPDVRLRLLGVIFYRFRSLCNSYFRRADGAILVYDCSVERTFLRIRDWIETVKDSVCKTIPILLVGNKIDLRREHEEPHQIDTVKFSLGEKNTGDGESLAEIFNDKPIIKLSSAQHQNILIASNDHFVSQKNGENLAKILETEFIECSALDGTNIDASLLLLVGEMMKQEDIQIKKTTVELTKPKKKSTCFSCRNN